MSGFSIRSEYAEITVSETLLRFATGIVSVFVPLYLYSNGFSMKEIMLLYGLIHLFYVVHIFLTPRIVSLIGVKHSMLSRGFVELLNLLLFKLVAVNKIFALGLIVTQGMCLYYWIPFHHVFSRSTRKDLGKGYAVLRSLLTVTSLVTPVLGALIITFSSYDFLFNIAIVLSLVSTVPLLLSKDYKVKFQVLNWDVLKRNFGLLTRLGVTSSISWIRQFFWPLLIFFVTGQTLDVGFAASIITFATILLTFVISFSKDKNLFVFLGVLLGLPLFILAPQISSQSAIILFSLLFGVYSVLTGVPVILDFYSSVNYNKDMILLREFFIKGVPGIFCLVFALLPESAIVPSILVFAGLLNLVLLK